MVEALARDKALAEFLACDRPDPHLFSTLADSAFVANRFGHLFKPKDMYNPKEAALLDLVDEDVFPAETYTSNSKASFPVTTNSSSSGCLVQSALPQTNL